MNFADALITSLVTANLALNAAYLYKSKKPASPEPVPLTELPPPATRIPYAHEVGPDFRGQVRANHTHEPHIMPVGTVPAAPQKGRHL